MVEGPPLVVDADRAAAYDELLRARGLIDYRLASQKHEFLAYAVASRGLLAYGSNHDDIKDFEPRPSPSAPCATPEGAHRLGEQARRQRALDAGPGPRRRRGRDGAELVQRPRGAASSSSSR